MNNLDHGCHTFLGPRWISIQAMVKIFSVFFPADFLHFGDQLLIGFFGGVRRQNSIWTWTAQELWTGFLNYHIFVLIVDLVFIMYYVFFY